MPFSQSTLEPGVVTGGGEFVVLACVDLCTYNCCGLVGLSEGKYSHQPSSGFKFRHSEVRSRPSRKRSWKFRRVAREVRRIRVVLQKLPLFSRASQRLPAAPRDMDATWNGLLPSVSSSADHLLTDSASLATSGLMNPPLTSFARRWPFSYVSQFNSLEKIFR